MFLLIFSILLGSSNLSTDFTIYIFKKCIRKKQRSLFLICTYLQMRVVYTYRQLYFHCLSCPGQVKLNKQNRQELTISIIIIITGCPLRVAGNWQILLSQSVRYYLGNLLCGPFLKTPYNCKKQINVCMFIYHLSKVPIKRAIRVYLIIFYCPVSSRYRIPCQKFNSKSLKGNPFGRLSKEPLQGKMAHLDKWVTFHHGAYAITSQRSQL